MTEGWGTPLQAGARTHRRHVIEAHWRASREQVGRASAVERRCAAQAATQ